MAKRWLRGPQINTPAASQQAVDHVPMLMFMYHFLTKLLGFTHIDEQVTGGTTRTFQNGHEATGTNGALSNSALTFIDATASPFVVGDVGKFLCILDATNPENCGIYEIVTYVSASQVTINFYVPGGTYPTTATGLTWWMFDTNNASYTPVTFGDYFVVRSPHATYPWEMQVSAENINAQAYYGGEIQVSPNSGAWDAVGHAWNSGARTYGGPNNWAFMDTYGSDAPQARIYAIGDTDGSFVLWWSDRQALGTSFTASMQAIVDPLESTPARSGNERLFLGGWKANDGWYNVDRGDDQGGLGLGNVWEDYGNRSRVARMMALIEENSNTDYFSRNIGVNARTGERDALPFMYSIEAEGATDPLRFAPHSKIPVGNISMGTAVAVGVATPFDNDDYYHLRNGIVIPWNGLPQQ